MIKEIYCKLPSDINYERKVETENEIEQILQQIRIILGTKPGQVLGSYDFGIDLKKYLFSYNQSQQQILYNVNLAIATYIDYDTERYNIGAVVSFGHDKDDTCDYAVIDILINENKCLGILVDES